MKVSDKLNEIKQLSDYVYNSLYLKSSDNYGCVYKWLVKGKDVATRKEIFIALDESEILKSLPEKTVIDSIEVYPAE